MTPAMNFLGRVLIAILRPFLYVWLKYIVNWNLASAAPKGLRPPYLILSTHVSVFELPLMLIHTKPNPVIVLHELHLVDSLFMMLLSVVGSIVRMQGLPDPRAIRQMKRAIGMGRSVIIYPEGDLNWDGDSKTLDIGLARAARFIGAPVLVFKTEGSYLGFPRWAHRARRGRVDLKYTLAVEKEDYAKLTDQQILDKLNSAFVHSERKWKYEGGGKGQRFSSSKPALGLERLLFLCPSCGAHSNTKTDDRNIWCVKCGFNVSVDANLRLSHDCGRGFKDVWEWHDWQTAEWNGFVDDGFRDRSLLLTCKEVAAEYVKISPVPASAPTDGESFPHRLLHKPDRLAAASATLTAEGIALLDKSGDKLHLIPIDSIRSVQVFIIGIYKPNWLIVMTDEAYINIQLIGGSNPCYPWLLAIQRHMENKAIR
ncbi:MAG: 1-acyl-sn-glycerol-3-phosphate acyltransferase [Firmicutes bacterium]|nr:1-acyl-sn-glycerol-3-phosphate acyltransferase [Bacillota bacterium]